MKASASIFGSLALCGMLAGCSTSGHKMAKVQDQETFNRSIHERMNDLRRRQLEQDHHIRMERSLESRRPPVTNPPAP